MTDKRKASVDARNVVPEQEGIHACWELDFDMYYFFNSLIFFSKSLGCLLKSERPKWLFSLGNIKIIWSNFFLVFKIIVLAVNITRCTWEGLQAWLSTLEISRRHISGVYLPFHWRMSKVKFAHASRKSVYELTSLFCKYLPKILFL